MINDQLHKVTQELMDRSHETREIYLQKIDAAASDGPNRGHLSCGNLAHGIAACSGAQKDDLMGDTKANVAIVSAYNDMLSAHQPYQYMPDIIKNEITRRGGSAQFAGGVPAMCDGVTQGRAGMELSLFSRDVIAMSTAVALSHNMFDAVMCLGICDKIVPGLLIGALSFGHLPVIFVPSGPMPTGLPNDEKARVRQRYAEGKADRDELLEAETASYHSAGTCTFYGTANSNQMLMEIMGLQLPGSSFVNPGTPLREALTRRAAEQVLNLTHVSENYRPLGRVIDEKAIINGVVGLLATGGSTNHTIHLVAIARAAGIQLTWDDFSALAEIVPLLTRIYPSGEADVNQFHAAGGLPFIVGTLLDGGLLHDDILTVAERPGLASYRREPLLIDGELNWHEAARTSGDTSIVRSVENPFADHGGLKVLTGNLGRAVIKTSAVKAENLLVEAPAIVFNDQDELQAAFDAGLLNKDFVAVVRFQGPAANGMPELHRLTPLLSSLLSKGFNIALVTDGRMSGASGKVPAAIHVTPECLHGGELGKIRTGDVIRLDATLGLLDVLVEQSEWETRIPAKAVTSQNDIGMGRELFSVFRKNVNGADEGAMSLIGR